MRCQCRELLEALKRVPGWNPAGCMTGLRCAACLDAIVEAKNQAVREIQGWTKAEALLRAGMGSQVELMDALKQKCREQEMEISKLKGMLTNFAARIARQSELSSQLAEKEHGKCVHELLKEHGESALTDIFEEQSDAI